MQARLILEDGTVFVGKAFGSEKQLSGEVVFNTGVTGYQEVLSNPSNFGQIVVMTQPLIGTYGISREQIDAIQPYIRGLVVRELEEIPSNWRGDYALDDVLRQQGIPGISEIDTRMLTRLIRQNGTMKGLITTSDQPVATLLKELRASVPPTHLIKHVSTPNIYSIPGKGKKIVVIDYGLKKGLIYELVKRNCNIVVVPHDTTAEQIQAMLPDGILLSNGPGNPEDVVDTVSHIAKLLPHYPLFGIGLGHQLLALACGAKTEKMKHGHRGNHPVKFLNTNKCYITSQNHGYTVIPDSIAGTRLEVTHINNNDQSIEGLKHLDYAAFSVEYHPEAMPGPLDSQYLFDEFIGMIDEFEQSNPQPPLQEQKYAATVKGGR